MTTTAAARAERLARARKEQTERGVDALLLGPSADLTYLTGYRPPALERLTMLRYGIEDLRLFFDGDLRFLEQFK
jgi:Xaa-Pro aminopeptidase